MRPQFTQVGRGTGRTGQHLTGPVQIPQRALAIRGEVPERVVARLRSTAGAEFGQQRLQRTVDGSELHEPRLIPLHAGQRQQDQQRLVRGVHTGTLGTPDVVEGLQDLRGRLHLKLAHRHEQTSSRHAPERSTAHHRADRPGRPCSAGSGAHAGVAPSARQPGRR